MPKMSELSIARSKAISRTPPLISPINNGSFMPSPLTLTHVATIPMRAQVTAISLPIRAPSRIPFFISSSVGRASYLIELTPLTARSIIMVQNMTNGKV